MPLPLILGIGAGIAAALGIGKGVKAAVDTKDAKQVNRNAEGIIKEAQELLKKARENSAKSLNELGRQKIFVLNSSIKDFITAFEKIKNIELSDSIGLEELQNFRMDTQSFTELRELSGYASSIAGGIASGAVGGALAAFGAYSGAMAFGAASTGTAISALSGVAATNATVAFLGGGSLAAGGLGMAGGALVLGGLVAGPALAIMGFVVGAKAKKNLEEAYSNLAEARKMAEELNAASDLCNAIRRRSYLFVRLLIRLDIIFVPMVDQLARIVEYILAKHISEIMRQYETLQTEEKKLARENWFSWIFNKKKREALRKNLYNQYSIADFFDLYTRTLALRKNNKRLWFFNKVSQKDINQSLWEQWLPEQEYTRSVNYSELTDDEKALLASTLSMAKAIKTVLDTPILTEDGKITEESESIAVEVKRTVDMQVKEK
jgi:hypothetical protein